MHEKLRVAVIGTGASGLACLHQLHLRQNKFEFVAFEHKAHIGGIWAYSDQTDGDEYGLPVPSMFRDFRTNLPKEAMLLSNDFPYPSTFSTFPTHNEVLQYLQDYAAHFNLYDYIRFYKHVSRVHPTKTNTGGVKWEVDVEDVRSEKTNIERSVFDAVMICNGCYYQPRMPSLNGLHSFKGTIIHSRQYRQPEKFQDLSVAVHDGGISGADIVLQLAPYAKQVFWCRNDQKYKPVSMPDNIKMRPAICDVTNDHVTFTDGQEEAVDVIILCTGYRYSYPFLTEECHVTVDNDRVSPLFKHVVHCEYPSLSFFCIVRSVCPTLHFDVQASFALSILEGKLELPSREEMEADAEADLAYRRSRNMNSPIKAHSLQSVEWEYHVTLAKMAGVEPVPAAVRSLCTHCTNNIFNDVTSYRNHRFLITDPNSATGFIDIVDDI